MKFNGSFFKVISARCIRASGFSFDLHLLNVYGLSYNITILYSNCRVNVFKSKAINHFQTLIQFQNGLFRGFYYVRFRRELVYYINNFFMVCFRIVTATIFETSFIPSCFQYCVIQIHASQKSHYFFETFYKNNGSFTQTSRLLVNILEEIIFLLCLQFVELGELSVNRYREVVILGRTLHL